MTQRPRSSLHHTRFLTRAPLHMTRESEREVVVRCSCNTDLMPQHLVRTSLAPIRDSRYIFVSRTMSDSVKQITRQLTIKTGSLKRQVEYAHDFRNRKQTRHLAVWTCYTAWRKRSTCTRRSMSSSHRLSNGYRAQMETSGSSRTP